MGRYLRERGLWGEIAVYRRTAILLQFRWGNPTEDVDVVIRTAERESAVKDAAAFAAVRLGCRTTGSTTTLVRSRQNGNPIRSSRRTAPIRRARRPGLRVFLAKPEYICAMKLRALQRRASATETSRTPCGSPRSPHRNRGRSAASVRVLFSRREPRSDGGRAPAGNRRRSPIAEASVSRPQDLREVAAATIARTEILRHRHRRIRRCLLPQTTRTRHASSGAL